MVNSKCIIIGLHDAVWTTCLHLAQGAGTTIGPQASEREVTNFMYWISVGQLIVSEIWRIERERVSFVDRDEQEFRGACACVGSTLKVPQYGLCALFYRRRSLEIQLGRGPASYRRRTALSVQVNSSLLGVFAHGVAPKCCQLKVGR